jgi:hypothetical protein
MKYLHYFGAYLIVRERLIAITELIIASDAIFFRVRIICGVLFLGHQIIFPLNLSSYEF